MSIRTDLIGEQFVKGNMNQGLQVYKIYYYPPEQNFPTSKIWLYFNRKQGDKLLGTKSLCFESPENHKKFILNNIYANIHHLVKRAEDHIPNGVEVFRYQMALLNDLLIKIRKEIPEMWKEKIKVMQR